MDNYRTIATKLTELEPFNGNSLTAIKETTWGTMTYKVYSYGTLIAEKSWDGAEGEWTTWLNPTKYSNTTSRGQNLVKKTWGVN